MDRRHLLATAAAAFTASIAGAAQAYKGSVEQHLADPKFLKSHSVRFIDLDTESQMDFIGQYTSHLKSVIDKNNPAYLDFMKSNGYSTGPVEMSFEESYRVMMQYAPYASHVRQTRANHEMMWDRALRSLRRHEDLYLSALESTDEAGPGHLELNPGLNIPEYARHEIHEQPGGYVGHPLAGLLYHYAAVTAFYHGLADGPVLHDERNQLMVAGWAIPPDKKIKRILELGTSHGSTTIALRERFDDKDIEVWGLDVAAPQVRYAHNRAAKMGYDIKFVQRLAEDTGFPDNHFDIVAINLLFHEVPSAIAKKIVPELHRITRPGGIWVGDASKQGAPRNGTILANANVWMQHRYNYEVWMVQNAANNFPVLRKEAGWVQDSSTGNAITMKA